MKKTASNIFKVLGYIFLVMGQYLLGGIIYIALILLLIPDLGPKWLVIVIAIIFYVVWFYILRGLAYLLLWLSKFLNKEVL